MKHKNCLALILLLLIGIQPLLYAQRENDNWYFGNKAGINFGGYPPISGMHSAMQSTNGCASISDKTWGNVLFYTNGINIWNAQNNVMPNGSGLLAGATATQGVLLLAYPSHDSQYVVITSSASADTGTQGIYYSIVDVRLDSGRGDVVAGQKNILLCSGSTERLTAATDDYGYNYWIMTHKRNSSQFVAYKLGAAGMSATPVTSNVGIMHMTGHSWLDDDGTKGQMKFSRNFRKLAVAIYGGKMIEIFDFNNETGIVSNPTTICTPEYPHGIEFAQDGSKLYYSLARGVYQLDMTLPTTDLQLSVRPVGYSNAGFPFGDLQLGPDYVIYAAVNNATWLSALAGPSGGFVDTAVIISSPSDTDATSLLGLPQIFVPLLYGANEPSYGSFSNYDSCNSGPLSFSFGHINNVLSVEWDFADPGSGSNYATGDSVTHQFATAGRYRVTAVIHTAFFNDTIARYVNVITCDEGNAPACKMYVPNAFSPDDNNNPKFKPIVTCPTEKYSFRVFDRWGEVVYLTDDPMGRWDGYYKGQPCQMGTYFYRVIYKFPGEFERINVGDVTLVR